VSADTGQLIRIVTGPRWNVDAAVWDRQDWESIPPGLRDALREVMHHLGQTSASRLDVRFVKQRG